MRAKLLVAGLVLTFSGLCALVACSSSSSSTNAGTDSGTSADDAASSTDGGPEAAVASGSGFFGVYLNQPPAGYGVVINAYTGAVGDRCYPETVAGCTIIDCRKNTNPIAFSSAGELDVSSRLAHPIKLTPAADKSYAVASDRVGAAWKIGDTVNVTAAGGPDVPPFTASIVMPDLVTILSPLPDGGTTIDLPRDQPFAVTWTTTNANVEIEISQIDTTAAITNSISIICVAPGAPGAFSVPVAALQRLAPSSADTSDTFIVSGAKSVTTQAGGATVLFDARNIAVGPYINVK